MNRREALQAGLGLAGGAVAGLAAKAAETTVHELETCRMRGVHHLTRHFVVENQATCVNALFDSDIPQLGDRYEFVVNGAPLVAWCRARRSEPLGGNYFMVTVAYAKE